MKKNLSRLLIETTIKSTLNDIYNDPDRSIRKLVDIACRFSDGVFQKKFFDYTRFILSDDNNKYYDLLKDITYHTDFDYLTTIGINIGYNGCTLGTKIIRQNESSLGVGFPWCISLYMNNSLDIHCIDVYKKLINDGKSMGLFTYMFICDNPSIELSVIYEENPDCTFLVFCNSDSINEELISMACAAQNVMFIVSMDDNVGDACLLLRENRLMFGLYYKYTNDINTSTIDAILEEASMYHPVSVMFKSSDKFGLNSCPEIYDYILKERSKPSYPILPIDLHFDNEYINTAISGTDYSLFFTPDGYACSLQYPGVITEYNIADNDLIDIIRKIFPLKKKFIT